MIASIPFLLLGAVILLAHFFGSLLVAGWCRITGRPIPHPQSLQDIENDNVA